MSEVSQSSHSQPPVPVASGSKLSERVKIVTRLAVAAIARNGISAGVFAAAVVSGAILFTPWVLLPAAPLVLALLVGLVYGRVLEVQGQKKSFGLKALNCLNNQLKDDTWGSSSSKGASLQQNLKKNIQNLERLVSAAEEALEEVKVSEEALEEVKVFEEAIEEAKVVLNNAKSGLKLLDGVKENISEILGNPDSYTLKNIEDLLQQTATRFTEIKSCDIALQEAIAVLQKYTRTPPAPTQVGDTTKGISGVRVIMDTSDLSD